MGYSGCNRDGEPRCARLLDRRGKKRAGRLFLPIVGGLQVGRANALPTFMRWDWFWEVRRSAPSGKRRLALNVIIPLQSRKAASGDLSGRDFGAGREESPEGCARGRKGEMPERRFSSSRPAPKGRERECWPFINRALHESSGSCAMEGWMLAASTVFIIRVGRVENPIRAPDKRLNNSEQNLKMERSARALCTLMIGFRPWI